MDKDEIIARLCGKDDKAAYEFSKQLGIESTESAVYLDMIPDFAGLLDSESSYVRTRGFCLICAQARWDTNGAIASVFGRMTPLLNDEKPTVVRQCLKALHGPALFRPELDGEIDKAVRAIDTGRYKDSMAPLIQKDIKELLEVLR